MLRLCAYWLWEWSNCNGSFLSLCKISKTADPKLDGTDYFVVAESMHLKRQFDSELLHCSLSFTCENDKKAFYKLIQDCLHFWFEEWFEIFSKQSFFSLKIHMPHLKLNLIIIRPVINQRILIHGCTQIVHM